MLPNPQGQQIQKHKAQNYLPEKAHCLPYALLRRSLFRRCSAISSAAPSIRPKKSSGSTNSTSAKRYGCSKSQMSTRA